jgi:hypothetical protein
MTSREMIEVVLAVLLIGGGAWLYIRRGKPTRSMAARQRSS